MTWASADRETDAWQKHLPALACQSLSRVVGGRARVTLVSNSLANELLDPHSHHRVMFSAKSAYVSHGPRYLKVKYLLLLQPPACALPSIALRRESAYTSAEALWPLHYYITITITKTCEIEETLK